VSETLRQASNRLATTWWEVPYCLRCSRHIAKHRLAKRVAQTGLWGGGAGIVLILIQNRSFSAAAVLLGALVAIALASLFASRFLKNTARKMMAPTCAAPSLAVEYGGWDGTSHELLFTSKPYFEAFLAANETKRTSSVRVVERFQEAGG